MGKSSIRRCGCRSHALLRSADRNKKHRDREASQSGDSLEIHTLGAKRMDVERQNYGWSAVAMQTIHSCLPACGWRHRSTSTMGVSSIQGVLTRMSDQLSRAGSYRPLSFERAKPTRVQTFHLRGRIEIRFGRWEPALLSYFRFDVVNVQRGVSISTCPIFRVDSALHPAVKT